MNSLTPFLARFRSHQATFGTWLSLGVPAIVELVSELGFDWILLDFEHGVASEAVLPDCLRALRRSPCAPIVRVPGTRLDLAARAMDWGAVGIMFPQVNSAQEAAQCVRHVLYPPRGERGFSRSARAYDYGLRPVDPLTEPPPLILVQIETQTAVNQAAEIARVPGVDALFVGPADLSLDLSAHPREGMNLERCYREVAAATQAAGIQAGTLVRNQEHLPRLRELGYRILALDSDLAILRKGFTAALPIRPPEVIQ